MSEQQYYPSIIYASPVEWGNATVYADAEGMEAQIEALKDAGGSEWSNIGIGECAQYFLINVCSDDSAAYRRNRTRDNREVVIFQHGDEPHYFEMVETYNTEYDDEELTALGVVANE